MTVADLIQELTDILTTEGVNSPPVPRVLRALNRGKDETILELEQLDDTRTAARKDYTVAAGDASITLPGEGTGAGTIPIDPPYRALLGVSEIQDDGHEVAIGVHDRRQPGVKTSGTGYWMYPEGDKFYFADPEGAPYGLTLRLRYASYIPDATDTDDRYRDLPVDWQRLVVLKAALALLPAGSDAHEKWQRAHQTQLVNLSSSLNRARRDTPPMIHSVDGWSGGG